MNKKRNNNGNHSKKEEKFPLAEKQLKEISERLYERFKEEKRTRRYASVKEILTLLARLGALTMVVVAPKTAILAKSLFKEEEDWEAWKRYNPAYLRRTISRMEKQKVVEIIEENDRQMIKITYQGKIKILKYALKELKIKKPKKWDGKWRLVIYDIPSKLKAIQEFFRKTLEGLSFYPLQKSVFLFPYPCENEIEYLRQFLKISKYVRMLTVEKIEHDKAFRTYFGLN